MKIWYYSNCSTCKKAINWFESKSIKIEKIDIVKNTPTIEELKNMHKISGKDINKFFNTSGKVYKDLNLKDKLNSMNLDDKYKLLSSNGMLIKRPIVTDDTNLTLGFKEDIFEEMWEL